MRIYYPIVLILGTGILSTEQCEPVSLLILLVWFSFITFILLFKTSCALGLGYVCTQILRVGNEEERSDRKMCSRTQVSPWKSHSILKMLSLLPSREQQGMLLSEGLWLPDIYLEGHWTKQFWEKLLWDPYVLCRQSKCNDCEACIGPKRFLSKIWAVLTAIWYWGTNRKGMFTTFMNESIKNAMHKNVWSQFHGETWKLVQGIQFPVLVP